MRSRNRSHPVPAQPACTRVRQLHVALSWRAQLDPVGFVFYIVLADLAKDWYEHIIIYSNMNGIFQLDRNPSKCTCVVNMWLLLTLTLVSPLARHIT